MSDRDTPRERLLLRRVLTESHRSNGQDAPPFDEVWSRAVAAAGGRRTRGPQIRLAVAAAAVALLVAASTIALWIDGRRSRQLELALTAATVVGEWRAPLDFLLETPGREWLEEPPRWDPGAAAAAPWGIAPGLAETEAPQSDST